MSRDPKKLHPEVAARWEKLKARCEKAGITIILTQGLRTIEEQDELYAMGRSKPGKVVTNAKGGHSWHNFGRAFDIAFEVIVYDPKTKKTKKTATWDGEWEKVGKFGEALGLTWGGRFKSFPDRPHFQWAAKGETLASLRAKKP